MYQYTLIIINNSAVFHFIHVKWKYSINNYKKTKKEHASYCCPKSKVIGINRYKVGHNQNYLSAKLSFEVLLKIIIGCIPTIIIKTILWRAFLLQRAGEFLYRKILQRTLKMRFRQK
jgi:hypothetical protein